MFAFCFRNLDLEKNLAPSLDPGSRNMINLDPGSRNIIINLDPGFRNMIITLDSGSRKSKKNVRLLLPKSGFRKKSSTPTLN